MAFFLVETIRSKIRVSASTIGYRLSLVLAIGLVALRRCPPHPPAADRLAHSDVTIVRTVTWYIRDYRLSLAIACGYFQVSTGVGRRRCIIGTMIHTMVDDGIHDHGGGSLQMSRIVPLCLQDRSVSRFYSFQ